MEERLTIALPTFGGECPKCGGKNIFCWNLKKYGRKFHCLHCSVTLSITNETLISDKPEKEREKLLKWWAEDEKDAEEEEKETVEGACPVCGKVFEWNIKKDGCWFSSCPHCGEKLWLNWNIQTRKWDFKKLVNREEEE